MSRGQLSSPLPIVTTVLTLSLLLATTSASSALDLAFSFETDLQGFVANGNGVTVTQDTIGATEGTQSMKVDLVEGATFAGALTDQLAPFIGDPPGLDFIRFDLTITEMFPEEAAFVDAGVTVFGSTQPDFPGGQFEGLSVQFIDNQVQLQELEVGTHEIQIDLQSAANPITFETGQTFNQIIGVEGSGQNDLIPTGFQIYINKSSDAPWTGYIDNVRTGSFSDAVDGDFDGDGRVDNSDLNLLLGSWGSDTVPPEWINGFVSPVDNEELNALLGNWGFGVSAAIPEPSCLALGLIALFALRPSARR